MSTTKFMDVKEFLESGFLFEINRTVLHPLGLALEINIDEDTGAASFGRIWDSRDDPEGFVFSDATFVEGQAKWLKMLSEYGTESMNARRAKLGFIYQSHVAHNEEK
jgi:hypothetical protein